MHIVVETKAIYMDFRMSQLHVERKFEWMVCDVSARNGSIFESIVPQVAIFIPLHRGAGSERITQSTVILITIKGTV